MTDFLIDVSGLSQMHQLLSYHMQIRSERRNLLDLVAVAEENPHITQQKMTKRTPRLLVLKILPLIYKEENKRTPSVDIRTIQIINVYPEKEFGSSRSGKLKL